jgi:hypothetical protein
MLFVPMGGDGKGKTSVDKRQLGIRAKLTTPRTENFCRTAIYRSGKSASGGLCASVVNIFFISTRPCLNIYGSFRK